MFKPTRLKIATMTCVSNFNVSINIRVLAKFLKTDHFIKEIRYRNTIKNENGISESKKVSFYNQISLVAVLNNEKNNVKLFSNGQVQITGCKSLDNVKFTLEKIKDYIYSIDKIYSIPIFMENGLTLGNDNCIYALNNIIGYKTSTNKYLFYNENVVHENNYFVSSTPYTKNKIKTIYNNLGEKIGEKTLEFYSQKRLKHKNTKILNGIIYNYKNEAIGKETVNITQENENNNDKFKDLEKIVGRFKAVEKDSINISPVKIVNINSVYDCNCEINREKLYDVIQEKNLFVKYDPNTYPGVNIKFIYNDSLSGLCNCDPLCNLDVCKKISIFVFQSGKIIITGANEIEQLDKTYLFINNILQNNKSVIKVLQPVSNLDNYTEI